MLRRRNFDDTELRIEANTGGSKNVFRWKNREFRPENRKAFRVERPRNFHTRYSKAEVLASSRDPQDCRKPRKVSKK